jgi:hypothetical protein
MTVLYLVKDYIEVVHKLIETSPSHVLQHSTYNDSLTIINFGLSTLKQLCSNFFSFEWLKQLWYFPIIVPEIATSMMEEISVLDGNFHNILSFLDKPIAVGNEIYGNYYLPLTCFEKIFTGLVNSLFIVRSNHSITSVNSFLHKSFHLREGFSESYGFTR